MDVIKNNQVVLKGTVVSEFKRSHAKFGEGFYIFQLYVLRLSGVGDIIPVMVSERLIDIDSDWMNQKIKVSGQYRSYNDHECGKTRLVLTVFAREIEETEEYDDNNIFLDGYICKEPIYRETPLGREIADLMLAVNRPYGKSDYIPCIAWGRNARFASGFEVGTRVQVLGRVQSREYTKKLSETECEKRVAYEISISKIEEVKNE